MNLLPVFTFVVQHFLAARVQNVVMFNCWNIRSQFQFLRNAQYHLLRTQMVDMSKDFEFPGRYLDGRLTALGIFLDTNCSGSSEILNKASDLQLFIARNNWLLIDCDNNSSKLRNQFEHSMMSIDAQITHAVINKAYLNEPDVTFILSDIYNNGKILGGKLNITLDKMMTCNETCCKKKYLTDLSLKSKYGNRCNLNDTTFRIATVVTGMPVTLPPEVIMDFLTSMNNSHLDTISRYGFKLVLILQEILNYKVNYFFVGLWSYNETAGGSVGALSSGKAELSSSPLVMTLRRLKMFTPLLEIGSLRLIFLFRTPHNEALYGEVFLSPFSVPVWVVFGVVLILFAILLWVIFVIEARIIKFLMFIPSILSTFLISFGVACSQSAALIPSTIGGRIAFFSLSIITFIMYNYYTSVIVSSLVGSPVKSNIKTLTQLADSSLNVGLEPAPNTMTYLNYSNRSGVKRFVKKKLSGKVSDDSPVWMTAEEGIIRAKDGGFAFHSEASTAYWLVEKHYMQHELCDLNEVKLRNKKSLYASINKNSPFEEIIRLSLFRMLERGLVSKHRRFWVRTKLECISNNILIDVGLEYTGPLFVFLVFTYIFALITLVLEIAYHKFALRRRLSQ